MDYLLTDSERRLTAERHLKYQCTARIDLDHISPQLVSREQKVVGFDALKAGIDALVCLRQQGGWNLARAPNSTWNLRLYLSYHFIAFNTFTI
jgi:hypothetical protein